MDGLSVAHRAIAANQAVMTRQVRRGENAPRSRPATRGPSGVDHLGDEPGGAVDPTLQPVGDDRDPVPMTTAFKDGLSNASGTIPAISSQTLGSITYRPTPTANHSVDTRIARIDMSLWMRGETSEPTRERPP